ncbi:MAG: tetratricopeptide repeat protein [Gammaproteobacteria bacterium]
MVFLHEQSKASATLTLTERPGQGRFHDIGFGASDRGGMRLSTVNWRAHLLIPGIPNHVLVDARTNDLTEHWQIHLAAQAQTIPEPVLLDPEESRAATQQFLDDYLDHLQRAGWTVAAGPDRYRLRLWPAFRFSRRYLRGERRAARWLPVAATTDLDAASARELELELVRRTEAAMRTEAAGWLPKLALFLASLVLFCWAFGMVVSWHLLPILLAVLLFHEGSHLFGMWLFGYRDLQMLMIPMLGAVAIGKNERAKPYQQAIVLFLGPLPGLILGCILFALYGRQGQPWLLESSAILIGLNYFNLLPLMPLDGGQLLSLSLFDRFPRLQALFIGLSAALLAVAGWFMGTPIFWILAVLMALACRPQWRFAGAYLRLRRRVAAAADRDTLLRTALAVLHEPPYQRLRFPRRYQLAQQLLMRLRRPHASLSVAGVTLVVHALALALPLLLFAPYWPWWGGSHESTASAAPPDWEARAAQAHNADERWQVYMDAGDWHLDSEDQAGAQAYFGKAARIAERFPADDPRRADTWSRQAEAADDPRAAQTLYQRALELQERVLGGQHPDVAATLQNLALTYEDPAEAPRKIALLERAVAIYRQAKLPERAGAALQSLASVYWQAKDGAKVEALLNQAVAELGDAKTAQPQLGQSLYTLAVFYLQQTDYRKAVAVLERRHALLLQNPQASYGAVMLADAAVDLGWAHWLNGDSQQALALFDDALRQSQEGRAGTALPPGLLDKLAALVMTRQFDDARPLFRRVQDVYGGRLTAFRERLRSLTQGNGAQRWLDQRYAAYVNAIDAMLAQAGAR